MAKKQTVQVPLDTATAARLRAEAEARDTPVARVARLYITKGMLHAADPEKAAQQMVERGIVVNGAPITIEEARRLATFLVEYA